MVGVPVYWLVIWCTGDLGVMGMAKGDRTVRVSAEGYVVLGKVAAARVVTRKAVVEGWIAELAGPRAAVEAFHDARRRADAEGPTAEEEPGA